MNLKKSFKLLLTLSVVLIVFLSANIGIKAKQATKLAISHKNEVLLPNIINNTDKINKIYIKNNKNNFSLIRSASDENDWELKEKGNFPVLMERVAEIVLGLADLRIIEPKTDQAQKMASLGLDVEQLDTNLVTVSILDQEQNELAGVLIGNREEIYNEEIYQEHVFVRKNDAQQAWLVKANLPHSWEFKDLVKQPLLPLDINKISKVVLNKDSKSKKDQVIIIKNNNKKIISNFVLAEIINNKNNNSKNPREIDEIPELLAEMNIEDVISHDQFKLNNLTWKPELTGTIETLDKIKLNLEFAKIKDKIYSKITVANNKNTQDLDDQTKKLLNISEQWLFEISKGTYDILNKASRDFTL